MKKFLQIFIVIFGVVLFPFLGLCEKYDKELSLDCYLFRQRSQCYTAIAYVEDLNFRIEKSKAENNIFAFDYLTNLLLHTLITGGPFGIRSTGPSSEEWKIIDNSFTFVAGLTVISKGVCETDENRLQEIINKSVQLDPSKIPIIIAQSKAVFSFVKDKIPRIDRAKLPTSRNFKEDEWFSFTKDNKVLIKGLKKSQEFYLLNTSPDGSCWMRGLACSNDKEFTGSGFVKKLLSLNGNQRERVCKFALNFFFSTLSNEYETLLQKQPGLLAEFKTLKKDVEIQLGGEIWDKLYRCANHSKADPQKIKEYESLMRDIEAKLRPDVLNKLDELTESLRNKILKFISKEEVFRILVGRKGQSNQDTDTLVTLSGGNVWNRNSSSSTWPNIWLSVYKLNHKPVNYTHVYLDSSLLLNDKENLYHSADNNWTFSYQGSQDIHVSALLPVGPNSPLSNMRYADKSYFNTWHKLKAWMEEKEPAENSYEWTEWK